MRRLIGEGWFMATVLPRTAVNRALVIDSDAPSSPGTRVTPDTGYAMPTHNCSMRLDRLLHRRFADQAGAPAAIALERPSRKPHDTAWLRQYHPP